MVVNHHSSLPDYTFVKHVSADEDGFFKISKVKEFWTQLAWPDPASSFPFVRTIYEAICTGAVLYASMCHKRLYDHQMSSNTKESVLSEKVLMAVNNMEHVQQQLQTLPIDLEVEKVLQAVEQQEGHVAADQCRRELETFWQDSHNDIMGRINGILATITEQMKPAVKKFVFHLAWAPEKLDPEKGLAPLMEYLENNLKTMYMSFLEANFNRVLETIWKLVLNEIATTGRANIGKEKPFFFERLFSSLSILVDFFHADGKALPLPTIQNVLYQDLEQELRLHKSDTPHLIELYYLQRLEDQTKLFHAPFGCLTVNAYYDETAESVCVEVVSARDLMPCDPNGTEGCAADILVPDTTGYISTTHPIHASPCEGCFESGSRFNMILGLSDPFVILELVPKHMFPGSTSQKTKVHKKTLYPSFNEHFEFPAKIEVCRANAAALSLVVMDYDYMRKNDFEGEAYVALNSLPGIDDTCALERAPTELVLMFPRDRSDILNTLAMRSWDKDALELVKQEKLKKS